MVPGWPGWVCGDPSALLAGGESSGVDWCFPSVNGSAGLSVVPRLCYVIVVLSVFSLLF